jgi:hypothetical protein
MTTIEIEVARGFDTDEFFHTLPFEIKHEYLGKSTAGRWWNLYCEDKDVDTVTEILDARSITWRIV